MCERNVRNQLVWLPGAIPQLWADPSRGYKELAVREVSQAIMFRILQPHSLAVRVLLYLYKI